MPPDEDLTEDLIGAYERVRAFFLSNPDDRCVVLFMHSFGDGMGFGVYQLVEDVLRRCSPSAVSAALPEALASQHASVRWWAAQIAADYPDHSLVPRLVEIVNGDFTDDERFAAALALQHSMHPAHDRATMQALLANEHQAEVAEMLAGGLRQLSIPAANEEDR